MKKRGRYCRGNELESFGDRIRDVAFVLVVFLHFLLVVRKLIASPVHLRRQLIILMLLFVSIVVMMPIFLRCTFVFVRLRNHLR